MPTAKQLCDQASQLPPDERMALVDQILDTLDERDESRMRNGYMRSRLGWRLTAGVRFKPSP